VKNFSEAHMSEILAKGFNKVYCDVLRTVAHDLLEIAKAREEHDGDDTTADIQYSGTFAATEALVDLLRDNYPDLK
jgi:hypothetical protein